ncbi:MAG: DNA-directed RNA polymerase subunit omega [Candidatus Woesearchaeota archaeon]|jgi:DNA-directed RNA polymerase subunit K/omega
MEASTHKMTKYEAARLIGARALQLSEGAPLAIELTQKELEDVHYDVIAIAKLELLKGKIPMTILPKVGRSEMTEEVLKKEAEVAKLEKELNLAQLEDDDSDDKDESASASDSSDD